MFDGRGDTGWVDVSDTLGSGAVQYRINAAGVCSVSVVATYSTTSGTTYTICTLPEEAWPAREWRGEAVFDAIPGTLVIASDGTTQIAQFTGATRSTVRASTTYLPG